MKTMGFYVDTAKFAFALIGGGTAGFFAAKGVSLAIDKGTDLVERLVGPKLMKVVGKNTEESDSSSADQL